MKYICDYGCGQEAFHQFQNGKWCCSKEHGECSGVKNKIKIARKKNPYKPVAPKKINNPDKNICEYGCGEIAKYQLTNGKWCCSKILQSCLGIREKMKTTKKKNPQKPTIPKKMPNPDKILCDYRCGQIGVYQFGNGRWCCSEKCQECSGVQKVMSENRKDHIPWNKGMKYGDEYTTWNKGMKIDIKQIQEKYPTFVKVEEMRYSPDKQDEKEIQVHCKNHNCKNSKELGGWFTLKNYAQLYERIREIEKDYGNGGSYFYCSDECKEECPLFGKRVSQLIKEDKIRAGIIEDPWNTTTEGLIWRKYILELDNNKCVWCGEKATEVHHIFPRKTHPNLAVDSDNGLSCCTKCHYKYGHRDRWCTTGYLASLVCDRIIRIQNKIKKII